jgi:hypothetical protein
MRNAINIVPPDEDLGFRFEADDMDYLISVSADDDKKDKKKATRKKPTATNGIIAANSQDGMLQMGMGGSYKENYKETDTLLRTSIAQIDSVTGYIETDLREIRSAKNLKKKYDYTALLYGTESSLIGQKISAIRELNSTINKINDMEFKRAKEMRALDTANNDDKAIMDLYQAMVSGSLPMNNNNMNTYNATVMQNSIIPASNNIPSNLGNSYDAGYQKYLSNISPEENMMLFENNSNIQEVVCYNQDTQNMYFDIMDVNTGQSVPNVPRKDAMFLENTKLDFSDMIARNDKLGESYRIVLVGNGMINTDPIILDQY